MKTPSGAGMLSIDLGKILQPLIAASLTDGATTAPTQPPTEVSTDGPTAAVADPWEAVRQVIDSDGLTGLLGRGLLTRLITNAIQTSVFAIVWKLAEERINARQRAEDHARLEENLSAASEKTSSEAEDK